MINVLLFSMIMWIWFFIAPVNPVYEFNPEALIYIWGTYLFLLSGFFLSFFINIKKARYYNYFDRRSLTIIALIGIFSFVLRLIDRVYIRHISFSTDFDQTLIQLSSTPPSVAGIIGALGLFFCYIPLLYSFLQKNHKIHPLYILIYFIPMFDAVMIGQRFQILTGFFLFVITYLSIKKINFKRIIFLSSIFSLILFVAILLIIHRYDNHNMQLFTSLVNSGYAQTLLPNDWILSAESSSGIDHYFLFILSNISQYFFHGIYEFSYLLDSNIQPGTTFGQFSLQMPYKLIKPILHLPLSPWQDLPHQGIYLSYFGIMYIDFGLLGLFFSAILGFIFGISYRKYKQGYLQYYFLYIYISYIIIMMPVTSMVSYGLGNNILTVALILITTKIRFK